MKGYDYQKFSNFNELIKAVNLECKPNPLIQIVNDQSFW